MDTEGHQGGRQEEKGEGQPTAAGGRPLYRRDPATSWFDGSAYRQLIRR
jgi:hypothetical protein